MIKRFYLILGLLFFGQINGQETAVQDSLVEDREPIQVNEFQEDFQQNYTDNDFNYEEGRGASENFLGRLVSWFLDGLRDLFGIDIDPDTYELMENILYVILIAVGLFFLVRLLLGQQATSFFGGNNAALAPLRTQEEDLTQIDLQALIDKALKQGDYRLAVRYMFLKSLKELSGKQLIQWHFEKTNNDYLGELTTPDLKKEFKTVSRLYDYIWYGEFPIDRARFAKAKVRFDQLHKTIAKHG